MTRVRTRQSLHDQLEFTNVVPGRWQRADCAVKNESLAV